MAVTWNPSDKNAGITLSSGNTIATSSAGSGTVNQAVRATQPISSTLKVYFEITFTSPASAQYFTVGIMNDSASLSANMGATNGAGFANKINGATSGLYGNGNITGSYPALVSGQVIRVAINRGINRMWWAINNNTWSGSAVWMGSGATSDDPATATGGFNISAITGEVYPSMSSAWTNDVATINGGPTFAYAMPSGFVQLDTPIPPPDARATQIALEHWASVAAGSNLALVTQVALEQWVPIVVPITARQNAVTVISG